MDSKQVLNEINKEFADIKDMISRHKDMDISDVRCVSERIENRLASIRTLSNQFDRKKDEESSCGKIGFGD